MSDIREKFEAWWDDKCPMLDPITTSHVFKAWEYQQARIDELESQLGWLLDRVKVRSGNVALPMYELSGRDIVNSMKALNEALKERTK